MPSARLKKRLNQVVQAFGNPPVIPVLPRKENPLPSAWFKSVTCQLTVDQVCPARRVGGSVDSGFRRNDGAAEQGLMTLTVLVLEGPHFTKLRDDVYYFAASAFL